MGSIIIAMPKHNDALHLKEMIRGSGLWSDLKTARSGSEILNEVENAEVSIVICTVRLSDMGYEELVNYLPGYVGMILLTKNASLVPFSSSVVKLLMPFKMEDLQSTIKMILPGEFYPVKKRKVRSPVEQKVIDDAKHLLMECNQMTEPEAFRYLQKNSMDSGRSLLESAKMILVLHS